MVVVYVVERMCSNGVYGYKLDNGSIVSYEAISQAVASGARIDYSKCA